MPVKSLLDIFSDSSEVQDLVSGQWRCVWGPNHPLTMSPSCQVRKQFQQMYHRYRPFIDYIYGMSWVSRHPSLNSAWEPHKDRHSVRNAEKLSVRRTVHGQGKKFDKLSSRRVFQNLNGKSGRWTVSKKLKYLTMYAEKYFLNNDISNKKLFS